MLIFNEKTHEYFDGEKRLISVTQLMRKHGLSPDYNGVAPEIMKASADRGTLIHKEIEVFNKNQEIGFTNEVVEFINYIEKEKINVIASEQMTCNDIVAGTIDLILKQGDETIIADIKTTSQIHIDAVSWQLSIYANLVEINITKGQCYHFDKEGKLKVVDIPIKPKEEVERLFECERKGEIYSSSLVIDDALLKKFCEVENAIKEFEEKKKLFEEQAGIIKQEIINAMEKNAIKTIESENIKITYIAPSKKTSIDSIKLKAEKPDIYAEYQKTSEVKASLRITISENKNNDD